MANSVPFPENSATTTNEPLLQLAFDMRAKVGGQIPCHDAFLAELIALGDLGFVGVREEGALLVDLVAKFNGKGGDADWVLEPRGRLNNHDGQDRGTMVARRKE